MVKLWSICRNTFLQTIRQPIFGTLILVTFGILVLNLPLSGWTMSTDYDVTDQKMMEALGLSTLLVSGLLVAVFSASAVLTREIEDKTALTVISKPVPRATFVLGKFAGVSAGVAVAFYLCGIVFLMTVRHEVMSAASDPYDFPVIVLGLAALGFGIAAAMLGNLFFGWSFTSAGVWSTLTSFTIAMGLIAFVGKEWKIVSFGEGISPQLLVGMLLIFLAVLVFVAVAIAATTRLGQIMTLMVCFGVFVVGSMHPFLFAGNSDQTVVLRVLGWVAPNLCHFYPLDALTAGNHIPIGYVAAAVAYSAVYVAAVLSVAVALFQHRQLAAEPTSAAMPGAVSLLSWAGQLVALATIIVALAFLSTAREASVRTFLVTAGMIAGAAALWVLWGYFGKGARWAYWTALVLTVLVLLWRGSALFAPDLVGPVRFGSDPLRIAIETALSGFVLLVLLLPKTRHHFASVNQ